MAHSEHAQQNLWVTHLCFDCHLQSSLTFVPALAFLFLILNSPLFVRQPQKIFIKVLLVIMQTYVWNEKGETDVWKFSSTGIFSPFAERFRLRAQN